MEKNGLTIHVFSFSYSKNSILNKSGHGIGFVFDMRGIDNPGRISELKLKTGHHLEVQKYLEDNTEMEVFLSHSWSQLEITIENFQKRNFSNLQINFGCTGGQHRSVYAAEKTAKHLVAKYPEINVYIKHLNEKNWPREMV